MTAEVIVMNRAAVAIAADSAVTIQLPRGEKIYQSANKLFPLSLHAPVGIMFYGSANFMEVPWETIVKIYRTELRDRRFPRLDGYAQHFLSFMEANRTIFPASAQKRYIGIESASYLHSLGFELRDQLEKRLQGKTQITEGYVKRILTNLIKQRLNELKGMPAAADLPKNYPTRIARKYGAEIDNAIDAIFKDLPLSQNGRKYLKSTLAQLFYRTLINRNSLCGVVVTGFGEREVFPSVIEYSMRGIADNVLWVASGRKAQVERGNEAVVIPFAQSEMVGTFMEGIDPYYREFMKASFTELIGSYIDKIVDALPSLTDPQKKKLRRQLQKTSKDQLDELDKGLESYRVEKHVDPVIRMISALPKDELAKVAESLVNLTSFKRRVSEEAETVAEPIDVAVISKGDKFVWIKRKQYFHSDLNPTWHMQRIGA